MDISVENIIRENIGKTYHMSFATVRENKPWVCELHFVYDENLNLYFRSQASRRHSMELSDNPYVSGNIVEQHAVDEYPHGIYFEGTARVLDDLAEQHRIYPLFEQRLGLDRRILDDAQKSEGHKFYMITISDWYAFGKFGQERGQKYHLVWNGGNK
ncbi:MAG: pyridoxamine 5'-phosphate oxidase family protein [Candidatus Saccharimonadia bacterium]